MSSEIGTAKDFLTYIAFAIGAAGTALVWPNIEWELRKNVVKLFMVAWAALAVAGALVLVSQHGYLKKRYDARRDHPLYLEVPDSEPGKATWLERLRAWRRRRSSGWTVPTLVGIALPPCKN